MSFFAHMIGAAAAAPPGGSIPTTGLVLHLNAGAGITKDGSDRVSQWNDQSGNAIHPTQATAGIQPLWLSAPIGGQPGVSCATASTSTRYLTLPANAALTTIRSVVVVTRLTHATFSATGNVGGFGLVSPNSGIYAYADPATNKWAASSPWDTAYVDGVLQSDKLVVPADMSVPHVFVFTRAAATNLTAGLIGASGAFNGRNWQGEIARVLYYNAVLSGADRQSLEDYLGAAYGITITH